MKMYRALLLGSVGLGLVSYQAYSSDLIPTALKDALQSGAPMALRVAEAEPAAETVAPAAPADVSKGVTAYYGVADASTAPAWAAEAAMNPDYAAMEPAAAAAPAADTAEATSAPAAEPAAAPAAAPAASTGVTAFFGIATKPDSEQPWGAAATMNPDYAAAAPAVEAPAPTAEATAPADAAPPVSLGGVGVTETYGTAAKPDNEQPWGAAATMNPDYTAAPTPAAAAEAPAEPAPAAVPEAPPVSLGGVGVTQYNGMSAKPDASQAWSASATMMPMEVAAPAAAPAVVNACADALNAEVKADKLLFEMSSWDIDPASYRTLDKLAKLAKDCGGVMIEVGGHTDNTGKPPSNKTLSDLRAQEVVKYLTHAGVDAGKLAAVGYGQDKPISDNATRDGRAQNRRIEFVVTSK